MFAPSIGRLILFWVRVSLNGSSGAPVVHEKAEYGDLDHLDNPAIEDERVLIFENEEKKGYSPVAAVYADYQLINSILHQRK